MSYGDPDHDKMVLRLGVKALAQRSPGWDRGRLATILIVWKGRTHHMTQAQPALDALIAEAQRRPISRVSFIQRALALGLSATAVAGLLAEIEGPVAAEAAAA